MALPWLDEVTREYLPACFSLPVCLAGVGGSARLRASLEQSLLCVSRLFASTRALCAGTITPNVA